MRYRTRTFYTQKQKSQMWDRWQRGDSLREIARDFGRNHSSIQGIFCRAGGIRPPVRRRCGRSLTLAEREEISRGLIADQSIRSIALALGRAASTISREIGDHSIIADVAVKFEGFSGLNGFDDVGTILNAARREFRRFTF